MFVDANVSSKLLISLILLCFFNDCIFQFLRFLPTIEENPFFLHAMICTISRKRSYIFYEM